jgi:CheY-like chemotaxis protein
VLIVDDHEMFRVAARQLLAAAGHAMVGEAGNGAEALAVVSRLTPDSVLRDVQLPGMDGFAAADRLAEREPAPTVVLVSSRDAYYVCAEALTNTVKHAAATAVTIRVEATPHLVTGEVADDVIGGADVAHGSGPHGLIDRVEALDGRVVIDSPASGGTRISVALPVVPLPAAVAAASVAAAESGAENRNRGWSNQRTGHDAGASTISYGRSRRVPERSPR